MLGGGKSYENNIGKEDGECWDKGIVTVLNRKPT